MTVKKAGKSIDDAAMEAWGLGCATVLMIGVLKFILAIFGERVQHLFHAAGKQGALAAIGIHSSLCEKGRERKGEENNEVRRGEEG